MTLSSHPPAGSALRHPSSVVVTGDVDSGKSTLIGRLLFDTGSLRLGAVEDVESHCRRWGREFEFAYLLDSLEEERQGECTIDTTQASLRTADGREFLFIDVPGHQELVVNMLSGASYADLAILVVDVLARVTEQTRRHAFILQFLGLDGIVVALNKMDLVDFDAARFGVAESEVRECLAGLGITPAAVLPVSARHGVNLVGASPRLAWHKAPSLLQSLGSLEARRRDGEFRFVAQDVYHHAGRPTTVGVIVSGEICVGDRVQVLPHGHESTIVAIRASLRDVESARAPESVGLVLEGPHVAARGSVLSRGRAPEVRQEIDARVFFARPASLEGAFVLRCATQDREAHLSSVRGAWDSAGFMPRARTGEFRAADVADVTIAVASPIVVDRLCAGGVLGRLTIQVDGETCAIGMVG